MATKTSSSTMSTVGLRTDASVVVTLIMFMKQSEPREVPRDQQYLGAGLGITHQDNARAALTQKNPATHGAAGLVTHAWWRQACVVLRLTQQRQNVLLALVGLCDHRG